MKKITALILSAVLLLSSVGALAAVGDVTINTENNGEDGEYYFMGGQNAAIGDTFYMMDYMGNLHGLRPGQADMALYTLDMKPFAEKSISLTPCALFAEGNDLKVLFYLFDESENYVFTGTVLYRIVLDGDHYTLEKERDVDWDAMSGDSGEGEMYPMTLENICVNNGRMFVFYYDEGMNAPTTGILDLGTGDLELLDLEDINISGVTAYRDGFLLLSTDYENSSTVLWSIEPKTWEPEEISRLSWDGADYVNAGAPVYDAESGRLYYCQGKALYGVKDLDLSTGEIICDMPADTYSGGAVFLTGGYYAMASEAVVVIRNVDKSQRPTQRMTIMTRLGYNTTVNKAFYEFLNTHGQIDPVMVEDNGSDKMILESFMNRDDSVDVYILYVPSSAFTTLYRRNYMAPIKSDILEKAVADMYPVFRDFCSRNGEVVCYPVESYSDSCMAVNESVLKQLGMTMEDVPRDWTGFLKWCESVNASLEEDSGIQVFEPFSSRASIRYGLIVKILQDYLLSLDASGDTMRGFESAELREALNTVAQMDLAAMNIPEEIDWDNWDYEDVDAKETLVSTWGEYMLRDLSWQSNMWTTLGLSVGKGDAHYPVNSYAAFVNPYSKHQKEAVEFIEAIVSNTEPAMKFTFSPKDNEPVRYSYYETNLKYYETTFENIRAQIEATTDAETIRSLEEYMDEMQEEFKSFEENSWEISPAGIEAYGKVAPDLMMRFYSLLDADQLQTVLNQAANGEISMEDFIRNLNVQMNMMLQEGN